MVLDLGAFSLHGRPVRRLRLGNATRAAVQGTSFLSSQHQEATHTYLPEIDLGHLPRNVGIRRPKLNA